MLPRSQESGKMEWSRYHFLVANTKFMLDEEHFKELLFKRLRSFGERDKQQDFWVDPKFLEHFPDIARRLGHPIVTFVSANATWITFMKLRLDRALCDSYEADSVQEALACNPSRRGGPRALPKVRTRTVGAFLAGRMTA